jgi:chromosome segregation ATPase
MSFLTNVLKTKFEDAHNSLKEVIVQFDPATATEAQIKTVADALAGVNTRLAELQTNVESAQKAVDADNALIHQYIDAATALSTQGKDDKAGQLLDEVEKNLNPKLEGDKQALADTQSSVAVFEARRHELEDKLRTARQRTEAAKRDLDRAKLDQQRANDQEQQAKRDAGILRSVDDLDVAGSAMEKAAQLARAKAQAARLNAESLSGVAGPAHSGDADIKAALAAASGHGSAPSLSIAERLAAAKAKSIA